MPTRIVLLLIALAAPTNAETVSYVGGAVCVGCHPAEGKLWTGSHHDLAMQPADASTVLGNFDNASFSKDGVTSTFSRRDGGYYVRTDGPDGQLHEYRIAYTFGVDPLQQYLLELPGGRYQALSIAWDSRPAEAGGQRWYHLYPGERIDHRDELHWTGPMQNWNFMCADCHSTNLRKNYRPAQERFETTWSDIDVNCEACHGPGSRHVAWDADKKAGKAGDGQRGLVVPLRDTSGGRWERPAGAATAHRTAPRASAVELDTCGRCHARAAQISDADPAGLRLADTRLLSLLETGRYHADGQIDDEVYEYGSFLQSKMYGAGVSCSDCHEPHSARLRAAGNALCAQCHSPAVFDSVQHHHHQPNSPAAQCVSCHMIERTYMGVDTRRDHSFRIPRPDLSERLGTPNACGDCHRDKSAAWATAALRGWYGSGAKPAHFGEAIAAGRSGAVNADAALARLIADPAQPAIARATAASLLPVAPGRATGDSLRRAAADPDPLVRRGAAESLGALEPPLRLELGAPLLSDPQRSVRLHAVIGLLDVPRERFSPEQLAALERAIAEYRATQEINADRADSQRNLGMLEARLGNYAAAERALNSAIRLMPRFTPAYVDLADLQRHTGRERDAEATLRRALQESPRDAASHHALGLSLIRQKRSAEALPEFAAAAQLAPEVPRFAYVYAIALHDSGQPRQAIDILTAAQKRHPAAREIIVALAQYEAQTGNRAAAEAWAQRLAELDR